MTGVRITHHFSPGLVYIVASHNWPAKLKTINGDHVHCVQGAIVCIHVGYFMHGMCIGAYSGQKCFTCSHKNLSSSIQNNDQRQNKSTNSIFKYYCTLSHGYFYDTHPSWGEFQQIREDIFTLVETMEAEIVVDVVLDSVPAGGLPKTDSSTSSSCDHLACNLCDKMGIGLHVHV